MASRKIFYSHYGRLETPAKASKHAHDPERQTECTRDTLTTVPASRVPAATHQPERSFSIILLGQQISPNSEHLGGNCGREPVDLLAVLFDLPRIEHTL